ncbi:unnamed protein product [Tetraodon nigroviridis]|uniref:(spotted green pufferfish) hypothetical protein n=1 Tax=Tetraodon nigroviridis TaxID=99883 RepID=Q4RYX4_TETNG|nr:unnamed protein product [Tetraodon nigroviridis]
MAQRRLDSSAIARGGDDRVIWLLSAAKWMEVKVQSGSHGVMLSGRWEDKQSLKAGDERLTKESYVDRTKTVLEVKQQNLHGTHQLRLRILVI